tara:strand:- start:5220 stop:5840 length:621 start_codon:yes stop_codon:yes gene_type:complete
MNSSLPNFHTFDPIIRDPLDIIPAVLSSMGGDHEELKKESPFSTDIQNLKEGIEPTIDPATILYLSIGELDSDGRKTDPIDSSSGKERLGRFPYGDGNIVTYLLENTKQKGDMTALHDLLSKLSDGLSEDNLGELGFRHGFGGLTLLGWLNVEEVSELSSAIRSGRWKVLSEEPLDGGVDYAFRLLLAMLRTAQRRRCGVLMRRHS